MGRKRQRNRSDAVKARPKQTDDHRVDVTTLKSAVSALVANAVAFETKRNEKLIQAGENVEHLLEPEGFLHLVVTFKFPPLKPKLRPLPIALKHSLWKEGQTEVCLIVKDPQRLVKDYLAQHGNGGVTRVLGVEKIRKRYGTHEGRREFSTMYDVFLVDNRVAPMMPNLLGNAFLQAKLMPLAVDMRKDVVASIQRTLKSTPFSPRQGTCTSLKVGRLDCSAEQLVENILMAVDGIARRCEGGWKNIQSLSLKTCRSPAVQIYLSLPGGNTVAEKSAPDNEVQTAKKAKVDAK
ncbi:Ribosomal protein L1p/L10e [Gracilaria domingensis]|nr:Ribosomal protein L1p/L10e [Gracilaria domingensis]